MSVYLAHVVAMVGVYLVLAYALNLVAGEAGLLSFCFGGIWGVGAYTATLATIGATNMPFLPDLLLAGSFGAEVAVPAAALAGACVGGFAALATLRFRGDVFILSTMALQAMLVSAMENAEPLTRGPLGIYAVPPPRLFGVDFPPGVASGLFCVAVASGVVALLTWLRRTRFGLALRALRDSERAAASLGLPSNRFLALAFVFAGAACGVGGALMAGEIGYVDPMSFGMQESILLVSMLLVGGRGTAHGPFVGALVFLVLPEILRFVGWGAGDEAAWRNIVFGGVLVALVFLGQKADPGGGAR